MKKSFVNSEGKPECVLCRRILERMKSLFEHMRDHHSDGDWNTFFAGGGEPATTSNSNTPSPSAAHDERKKKAAGGLKLKLKLKGVSICAFCNAVLDHSTTPSVDDETKKVDPPKFKLNATNTNTNTPSAAADDERKRKAAGGLKLKLKGVMVEEESDQGSTSQSKKVVNLDELISSGGWNKFRQKRSRRGGGGDHKAVDVRKLEGESMMKLMKKKQEEYDLEMQTLHMLPLATSSSVMQAEEESNGGGGGGGGGDSSSSRRRRVLNFDLNQPPPEEEEEEEEAS